jgi:Spy/CpxP family protein refolding chaperone
MNRKTLFLFLGVLTLGFAANAQTTDTTHTMHRRFHGQNQFSQSHFGRGHHEFVHYTPDQRKQVMAINKDYRQKREDLYKQDNSTLKQYKAGLLALDNEKNAKLQALLTPQQKDQIASRHKKMDENRQVMAAARLERLRLQLNLTDDQVAQIKAGQQNLRNQAQAIRDNDNLLPQQKHEQIRALMTARNDNFKTILTPDQYSKFQQMMSHRHFGGRWQGRGSRMS